MEVVANNYMPGDPRLVEQLVYELKSQGIFDQFRKECIADVDTKPAYQNLRQRVEGSVTSFLKQQTWKPDMNKNQVREQLRKNIYESGFLDTGVERIVDQVVNPKINTIFLPKVEDVVYRYLGIEKPNRLDVKKELKIDVTDLLPTDLEAISPESDHVKDECLNCIDSFNSESKTEEDESPPFEPIDVPQTNIPEENSVDSHLSGFSGLQSHESNPCTESKPIQMELSNQDSQVSQNSSESHLSIITSEDNTKMDIREESDSKILKSIDSNSQMEVSPTKPEICSESHLAIQKEESVETVEEMDSSNENKDENLKVQDTEKVIEKRELEEPQENQIKDKRNNERRSDEKKSKSSDKHSSKDRDRKDDKHRKRTSSCSKDKEKSSSKHRSSSSSKDRSKDKKESRSSSSTNKDKEKSEKDKDGYRTERDKDKSKNDKDKDRTDKDKYRDKKDKDKSDKDKTEKSKTDKDKEKSGKDKVKKSSSNGSSSKHSSSKEKDKSSSSVKSDSSKREKEKSRESRPSSTSSSKDNKSKSSSSDSKSKSSSSEKHKKDEKSSSSNKHSSSSTSSKRDKDKDRKKSSKKDVKDDHYSSKDKKNDRRSTDRDSNDGRSSRPSNVGGGEDSSSSQVKKSNQESSNSQSSSGSGDSGASDATEHTVKSPIKTIVENKELQISFFETTQNLKYIKPKFASNFEEARKLMKIRKQLAKLERQNQLSLAQIEAVKEVPLLNGISFVEKENVNNVSVEKIENVPEKIEEKVETPEKNNCKIPPKESPPILQSRDLSKENWEALEARLEQEMSNINYNSYESPYDDYDYGSVCNSTGTSPKKSTSNTKGIENDNIAISVAKRLEMEEEQKHTTNTDDYSKMENKTEEISNVVNVELDKHYDVSNTTSTVEDTVPQIVEDIIVDEESKNGSTNENDNRESRTESKSEAPENNENIEFDNNPIKMDTTSSERLETVCEDSDADSCMYLQPLSPQLEKNLQFLYRYIERLEQNVEHSLRTFQNNFLPLKENYRKRKLVTNEDIKSNNKAHYEQTTVVKKRRFVPPNSNSVISKANKVKLCNNSDISPNDSFSLPLSPAESDKSNEKKEDESPKAKQKRESLNKSLNSRSQRYSSEDLYKPRPIFISSRRSRGAKKVDK